MTTLSHGNGPRGPLLSGWCAGLFEGEGAITRTRGRRRLALKMVSEESVRRFHEHMGLGRVYGPYGPYESQLGRTAYFLWLAEGYDAACVAAYLIGGGISEPWRTRLYEVVQEAADARA